MSNLVNFRNLFLKNIIKNILIYCFLMLLYVHIRCQENFRSEILYMDYFSILLSKKIFVNFHFLKSHFAQFLWGNCFTLKILKLFYELYNILINQTIFRKVSPNILQLAFEESIRLAKVDKLLSKYRSLKIPLLNVLICC